MIPVIMSGGSGSRLWPLSRAKWPKQFCDLGGKSLIEETVERLLPHGEVHFLTVKELETLTARVAQKYNLSARNMVLEPFGRNTAPAIALLCRALQLGGKNNDVVGVFPADHQISNLQAFHQAVATAAQATDSFDVVTLGIQPSFPATGFGYIEVVSQKSTVDGVKKGESSAAGTSLQAAQVLSFREKPDLKTAQGFVAANNFLWNAGTFFFRLDKMIHAFTELAPEIWREISQLDMNFTGLTDIYKKLSPISFDYALMEKIKNQGCVPCDINWSDMGSWDQLAEHLTAKNEPTSLLKSNIFSEDAQNNFAFTQNEKTVAFVGCNDLIVADTPDALLVLKKGDSQKVKGLYDQILKKNPKICDNHGFEFRPWGSFQILAESEKFKLKLITVNPGAQLSYQSHKNRAEHWTVISGQAEVVLNDEVISLRTGEHVFIPLGAKHRMRNPGTETLEFVELQTGNYFGEDDITRYQDDYQRI